MTAAEESEPLEPGATGEYPRAGVNGQADPEPAATQPLEALSAALGNLGEVVTYAQQLVQGKANAVLYQVRKVVLMAMLGVIAGLSAVAALMTCAVLLIIGLAGAVGALLPDGWQWAGQVLVGGGGTLLSLVAAWLVIRRAAAAGRTAASKHYRLALIRQRQQYGTDAMERAEQYERRTGLDSRPAGHEPPRPDVPEHERGVGGDKKTLDD
jgi:hypothetical protein